MSMLKIKPLKYNDGRTKQHFKDDADIGKILAKASKAGTLSHLEKHGAEYADFADFDFDDAQFALSRARSIFEKLPGELRKEFDHTPSKFFEFVNDPENLGMLAERLPALAEPGRQLPAVRRTAITEGFGGGAEPQVTNERASEPSTGSEGGQTGDVTP